MKKKLYNLHDKLFRDTWSNHSNAKAFLQNYLPDEILKIVQLDSLEICKDSFIEKELKDYFSDMLYKVNLGKEPGYIYFLFEHKSYADKLIHIQLLEYMIKIWRLDLKQAKGDKLSIIIPLVLYHGRDKWKVNRDLSSVFKGPADLLSDYIPDFKYILYDLSEYTDDQIKGTIMARVVMLLFKYIFDPDCEAKLQDIFSLFKELSEKETGLQYFESLVKYILNNVENITAETIQAIATKALTKDKGEIVMILADQLRNEGLKQGLEKGLEQGLEKGLEKGIEKGLEKGLEQGLFEGIELAISIKFDDQDECKTIISKIKSIKDINRLQALKGKIKSVKTIPELNKYI